jgi:hypothetical protein
MLFLFLEILNHYFKNLSTVVPFSRSLMYLNKSKLFVFRPVDTYLEVDATSV